MKTILCIVLLALVTFSCQKEVSQENIIAALPTVTTAPVTSITSSMATSGGNITNNGGAAITARGVCWSTSPNPTITLSTKTSDGTGSGVFTSNITGLTTTTVYYVRAWATNSEGTAYGNEISFTTTNTSTALPTVTTTSLSSVTMTTATGGGNVVADGGAPVTARGVCWSTTANPTIALSTKTTDGGGSGAFTSAITGLTAATTYHVRAYATNSVGTSYGGDSVFTTSAISTIPAITTTAVSAITTTTAGSGGTISNDGGAAVTVRGVCWSTAANPTIALSTKTTDGAGIGTFTSAITGLSANTTYHVRAYATNSVGTAYGNDVTFITNNSSSPDVYVAGVDFSGVSGNGIATLWKNGVPTFLTDGTNDAEARGVFVSGTDVWVFGRETVGSTIVGHVWKNGLLYNVGGCGGGDNVRGMFISGTDVYVAGACTGDPAGQLSVWKNNVVVATLNGISNLGSNGLFVSGSDIYFVGTDGTNQVLWKNGVTTTIINYPVAYGWDNSVFVSGSDTYVAFNGNDPNNISKLWKNGVVTNLPNISGFSLVHDVFVSGTDVYAAGADPTAGGPGISVAVYWKNGVRTALSNGVNYAHAESVFVLGTDVYVAGGDGVFGEPTVWKNGVATTLPGFGYAFSVFVK
jgi:hypothetical protein